MFNETRESDITDPDAREIYERMPQSLKDAISRTSDAKEVNVNSNDSFDTNSNRNVFNIRSVI